MLQLNIVASFLLESQCHKAHNGLICEKERMEKEHAGTSIWNDLQSIFIFVYTVLCGAPGVWVWLVAVVVCHSAVIVVVVRRLAIVVVPAVCRGRSTGKGERGWLQSNWLCRTFEESDSRACPGRDALWKTQTKRAKARRQ